jgi:hypothetical protein
MTDQLLYGRTFIDGGFRCAIAQPGRKWLRVAYIADGNQLVCDRVAAAEAGYFRPLPGYDSAPKMARAMLRGRKVAQMSKSARQLLQHVIAGTRLSE